MSDRADVHGILLLDKPLGLSSAAAVARAKYLFGARKAGHTGSLDPLATGALPICFGEATKFGTQLLEADKTYRVIARLGERTASADLESPVIERQALPPFSSEQIGAALREFPRAYDQVPPMHSAIKQEGKPLYEYARAGLMREREPRRILIHGMNLLAWRSPDMEFEVRCSKGAYIRVLAEDLAQTLGTLAHLTALRRLGVAPFEDRELWGLEALEGLSLNARRELLLPVDAALAAAPRYELSASQVAALRQGKTLDVPAGSPGTVRLYSEELGFLGLGELEMPGHLVPLRLISASLNRA